MQIDTVDNRIHTTRQHHIKKKRNKQQQTSHFDSRFRHMQVLAKKKEKKKDAHRWKVSWHSWQSFFFFFRLESTQQASITFNRTGHTDGTIFAKTETD